MASKIGDFFRSFVAPKEGGDSAAPSADAVEHEGYTIQPAARREGGQWLTVGVIYKEFEGGEVKEQQFIRADFYSSKEEADACAVRKGKQIIEEQGDKLFK